MNDWGKRLYILACQSLISQPYDFCYLTLLSLTCLVTWKTTKNNHDNEYILKYQLPILMIELLGVS